MRKSQNRGRVARIKTEMLEKTQMARGRCGRRDLVFLYTSQVVLQEAQREFEQLMHRTLERLSPWASSLGSCAMLCLWCCYRRSMKVIYFKMISDSVL